MTELESLQRGIDDKIARWKVLRSSIGDRVHGIGFDAIITRAESQADEVKLSRGADVRRCHLTAATRSGPGR